MLTNVFEGVDIWRISKNVNKFIDEFSQNTLTNIDLKIIDEIANEGYNSKLDIVHSSKQKEKDLQNDAKIRSMVFKK